VDASTSSAERPLTTPSGHPAGEILPFDIPHFPRLTAVKSRLAAEGCQVFSHSIASTARQIFSRSSSLRFPSAVSRSIEATDAHPRNVERLG
jgi:hypothetical protein